MLTTSSRSYRSLLRRGLQLLLAVGTLLVLGILVWQGITASGAPDPTVARLDRNVVILDTGILVFREGLEAVLVIAAITASFMGANNVYRRPVFLGAALALLATAATWFIAIAVISAVDAPALDIQAATGLLAIAVLLVIMNWFFHTVYWTGWISHHNKRRRSLMSAAAAGGRASLLGFMLLGF